MGQPRTTHTDYNLDKQVTNVSRPDGDHVTPTYDSAKGRLTALATSRTHHLLTTHAPAAHALTAGFQRALLAGSIFLLAAGIIALKATNTRGEMAQPASGGLPEPARA